MTLYINDSNLNCYNINGFKNGALFFKHSNEVKIKYKASSSVKFVQKGNIEYKVDGKSILLSSGELLFINEGILVETVIPELAEGYSLFFEPGLGINKHIASFPIFDTQLTSLINNFISRKKLDYGCTCKSLEKLTVNYIEWY